MKKSLDDIRLMLKEIANEHANIETYHFGDFLEAISMDAVLYPLMVVTPITSNLTYKKTNVSTNIMLLDKYIESNYEMRNSVLSDMLEVCSDIRALMRKSKYDDFEIDENITVEPRVNKGGDIVAGWIMTVNFNIDDEMNYCTVPNNIN